MPGIGYWLTRRELLSPDKEAVVDGSRRLGFRELNQRVNRLSWALRDQGLKKGDRLSLLAHNSLEWIEVIMASAKLGLILVPLNWRLTGPELAFQLKDSGAKYLIFDPELTPLAQDCLERSGIERRMVLGSGRVQGAQAYEPALAGQSSSEPVPDQEVGLDDPHIIMYTAGTTGAPKGAVLSQRAAFYNALNLNLALDLTSADRDLMALPMFHIGGIGLFTLPMIYQGGTVVIQRTFDPKECLRLLKEERISLFFGVPAIFLFLIQDPGFEAKAFDRVRLVMSGGAPLPISLVEEYHRAGIVLQQGFGMSEAAPSIATLPKELALDKAGSIGRPVFHLEVRIVDQEDREAAPGEVGELVMRGPNLLKGYWNRDQETAQAFKGGWFHSGDLARMDEDGCLYIVDRKKDMFISGGENVYPAEVENAIYDLPQVAEAAVIGVRDEKWGEVGRAMVVLKEGRTLTPEDLTAELKKRLAKYKIPKSVVFLEALPRNAAGKVLKNRLRENREGV